jgi:hypothetical protein
LEFLVITQSAEGANDGSTRIWINGVLNSEKTGLAFTPGMDGFEFPTYWGGSGTDRVSVANMYTDWDVFYISAGN